MAPLEKEVMENILGNVISDNNLPDYYVPRHSVLDAFLALSAVSKAWRLAAEAPQLWRQWLFLGEDCACDAYCTSKLNAWFAKRQYDFTAHQVPAVYPRGQAVRPITGLIILAPKISAMPLFVKAHTNWAKEVSIVITGIITYHHSFGNRDPRRGSLASFAHFGFHQLYFPELERAYIYNPFVDLNDDRRGQNWSRFSESDDISLQPVELMMCAASLSPLKTAKAVDIECLSGILVKYFLQTCHGLQQLKYGHRGDRVSDTTKELQAVLMERGLGRDVRAWSWAPSSILHLFGDMPLLESLGVAKFSLPSDPSDNEFLLGLFDMLKDDSPLIRFLALSIDSHVFENDFASMFLQVPPSVQHLLLEFKDCHFVGIHDLSEWHSMLNMPKTQRRELAVILFDHLRPFLPSSVQLHINWDMDIACECDVVRETFHAASFVSTSYTD